LGPRAKALPEAQRFRALGEVRARALASRARRLERGRVIRGKGSASAEATGGNC